jgi:hypothetical protein
MNTPFTPLLKMLCLSPKQNEMTPRHEGSETKRHTTTIGRHDSSFPDLIGESSTGLNLCNRFAKRTTFEIEIFKRVNG